MAFTKLRQRGLQVVFALTMSMTVLVLCQCMAVAEDTKQAMFERVFGDAVKHDAQKQTAPKDPALRKACFVDAVVRGKGLMPWQKPGPSPEEVAFRKKIEVRKDRMLANMELVEHPALLSVEQIARSKRNIEKTAWGKQWFKAKKNLADYVVAQDDAWIKRMIPELTPTNPYGFTCPKCVGVKSLEGSGRNLVWDYRKPDVIRCRCCGQTYPSADFPETATLQSPRMRQTFTYYQNERQRAAPEDHTGRLAYHWVGRPINVSFTGVIRMQKISFMIGTTRTLALAYLHTGDSRYAAKAVKILERLAHCYRNWLYHDYWDTVADCDPMYAAWHDKNMKLEWKRHLSSDQYRKDTPERASMLQSYWGAGRAHTSTDIISSSVPHLCLAFDLTYNATDSQGKPLWTPESRTKVARDLILEWIIGAEPFLGGQGKATNVTNKAPRIYATQAIVAKVLGEPQLADVALRGYEAIRERSFLFDGFSRESPDYTNMYLRTLLFVSECLDGFTWPADFKPRQGTVNLFKTDQRLRCMLHAVLDQLQPDGRYAPLSDTPIYARISRQILEIGLNRYPEYFRGKMPTLYRGGKPGEYAVFNLESNDIETDTGLDLPEIFYPAWMTAFLRHGSGPKATMLAMVANAPGNHRHADNLSVFYLDRGQTILGDQGYFCDMPQNKWIKSTFSHNLVVVDDKGQDTQSRVPKLHMMFTTPTVSVVECSSTAYPMCSEYRRLVAMIKGHDAETFVVDVFRVKGGCKHAFRVFSEIGASDAEAGGIELVGVNLPPEKPMPNFGGSLEREHIYGLRDIHTAEKPKAPWQAIWQQKNRRYRMWMLSSAGRMEISNGPGQETQEQQFGRRVRYVDTVNEGDDLNSTFVAIHEPGSNDDSLPISDAKLLEVPVQAGDGAVAVKVESKWGTYLLLSGFDNEATIEGTRFKGKFGMVKTEPNGKRRLIGSGAATLKCGDLGFVNRVTRWTGVADKQTDSVFATDTPMPKDFPPTPNECQNYVLVDDGKCVTGYAVGSLDRNRITVRRFPLDAPKEFDLPTLRTFTE